MSMSRNSPRATTLSSESGSVLVTSTSTKIANATTDVDPTSIYPRRKLLMLQNTGSNVVYIGIGFTPTTSNYSHCLTPVQGTVNTSDYIPGGVVLIDAAVPQDQINGICESATTTTVYLTIGV